VSFFESPLWKDFVEGTMPALVRELRELNKRLPPASAPAPTRSLTQAEDRESRAAEDAMRTTIRRLQQENEVLRRTHPFDALKKELHADQEYAWTWQCNIAMAAYDQGIDRDKANNIARLFMQRSFGVDPKEPLTVERALQIVVGEEPNGG
jgi:hypothetical protein